MLNSSETYPANFIYVNLNIFHADVKENVSGCFFLNTVYLLHLQNEWSRVLTTLENLENLGHFLILENLGHFLILEN